MGDWWTYHPEDFLMFSERVYTRLFMLHNQALWPAQLLALALGGLVLFALLHPRPGSSRLVAALLAMAWVFVAWSFLWQRYVPINWGIRYLVPLFVLQALLLIIVGATRRDGLGLPTRWSVSRGLGLVLFTYALVGHPFVAPLVGRGLTGAEIIGLTPDPLAFATLGVAVMASPAGRTWTLAAIPALWCLISGVTLAILDAAGAWLPPLAVVLALLARWWPEARR
ncbi:DUF6064 family protein [Halomonas cerina]|uniref:MFS transporter permease n=1 Tax=Halomonas cerina TaxID=447424 RepID=A0A839V6D1_9GAMM|nr:DUF6064 family protein [Halomonas cerina]MBB3190691.1 hypothetical protein [Halomonas cerina]